MMQIINSALSDIQKESARDMWLALEQKNGYKNKDNWVYQLMKDVYTLMQGDKFVVEFYNELKLKWEDLDYHCDAK